MEVLFEENEAISHQYAGKTFHSLEMGNGKPIVFIPGTGGDEKIFKRIQVPLSREYRTIAFSHIHLKKVSDVVDAWHEVLSDMVGEPFHLLGTSVGGRIVQYYAERYPDDLLSVTIGNSYVDNSTIRKKYKLTGVVLPALPMSLISRIAAKGMLKGFEQYENGAQAAMFFQKHVRQSSKSEFISRVRWNLEKLPPPKIEVPTHVIYSGDDPVIDRQTRDHLNEYYRNAEKTKIDWGGHFPYIINPEPYLEGLYGFVTSLVKN